MGSIISQFPNEIVDIVIEYTTEKSSAATIIKLLDELNGLIDQYTIPPSAVQRIHPLRQQSCYC